MDQVLVDFHSHPTLHVPKDSYNHENIYKKGYFLNLKPKRGALESVRHLINSNEFDVFICSQPLAGSPNSFSEKAAWIRAYLPQLQSKIILACDKSLVRGHYLIDDSIKWKQGFEGEFIHFDVTKESDVEWDRIVGYLSKGA